MTLDRQQQEIARIGYDHPGQCRVAECKEPGDVVIELEVLSVNVKAAGRSCGPHAAEMTTILVAELEEKLARAGRGLRGVGE